MSTERDRMIERRRDGEVLILELVHGKANALDLEMLSVVPDAMAQFKPALDRAFEMFFSTPMPVVAMGENWPGTRQSMAPRRSFRFRET